MIKTNNGSFLLRLEQKVLESINLYVDSGEQFLNIPDREVFDDEFVKFKAKNIQKVVFCLDNNKFYLLSNGGALPSDKFVVLFDEEKYGYNIPDTLTAELMKNILLTRFSEGKFGIFSCDDFYQLIFKYHKCCDSKSSNLDLDERNFRTALRRYKFSNTNSDFEVKLKDFVFDVFFKGETKYAIISLEKGWFTTQLKDFLFNFINSEDKLLFLFKNLTNPFGRKNLLFSISKKIPGFNLLNFYKNLLLDYNEMSIADLISIANELSDDFFKLFENPNLKLKITPKFNKDYFEKFKDESFEMNFGKLVEDKRIQMIDLEILMNKMEDRSKCLKKYKDSLQQRLDGGNLDKSKFKDDFSRFNTEYIEFNVALKTLILFKKQLSDQKNEALVKLLKKIGDNLTGTGFSGQFSQIHEN
jgi:hypothetical protein